MADDIPSSAPPGTADTPTDTGTMAQIAGASVLIEKYILPLVYFGLAWNALQQTLMIMARTTPNLDALGLQFAESLKSLLLFLLPLFVGLMLLLNTKPVRRPANLREIVIPLIGSFYYIAYNVAYKMPEPLHRAWMPIQWQPILNTISIFLSIVGYGIAIWGVMSLGRSFAMLVSVREIVLRGPYRFVRHPIYSGYMCAIAGILIMFPTYGMLILVAVHFWLFVYRGRMEERRLAEHSAEYREYMKGTGFILPKLGGKG